MFSTHIKIRLQQQETNNFLSTNERLENMEKCKPWAGLIFLDVFF